MMSDLATINSVLIQAKLGSELSAGLSLFERAEILKRASNKVCEEADLLANLIVNDSSKTIRQARKEVSRCTNTLLLSSGEAKWLSGEIIPFEAFAGQKNRQGYSVQKPLGIIFAITPYNDPLNLVAHKLGPAIAGGNSVILKPSRYTTKTAKALLEILLAAGLDESIITLFEGGRNEAAELMASQDLRMVSFTGGTETGEAITRQAGLKKTAMELGGNAPVIISADAHLGKAAEACVAGAFWAAGQNCIGVQRILIDDSVYQRFSEQLVSATKQLKLGDPLLESTDIGPMINEAAAQRIESWVQEALEAGASLLCGHHREGRYYSPTVLANVPLPCNLWALEVFAPVVILQQTQSFNEAIKLANSTDCCLHATIFTQNLETALYAADQMEAGGVMINDSSDYRIDAMPFGGFKYGSMGREGVKYALEEMTQTKVICFNR